MDCLQFLGGRVIETEAWGVVEEGRKLAVSASLKFASGAVGSFTLGGCEKTGEALKKVWIEAGLPV